MKNKIIIILIIVVLVLVGVLLFSLRKQPLVSVSSEGHMESTPVEVEQIRAIGEWEFLTVSDEEIVDTVRHGFFGDDELSRIYYGTLRFGIDMSKADEQSVSVKDDSLSVRLPAVGLLDDHFIDEARTRSFIEEGKWSEADKAALTRKAARQMRRRCLTPANLKAAKENAQRQTEAFFKAWGYKHVKVTIGN
jgi:hypothetical protein